MSRKWTTEQSQAINTTGVNLLVSAAAGSGKTAVLAERCAYLVCEAPDPCDVTDLLVVTFTNAAAEEMRSRIGRAIARCAEKNPAPRLQQQSLLINSARISTIHSLGQSIIRRHFHELGIDPNFRLLDEDEAKLMRADLIERLLEERFNDPDAHDFRRLVDQYSGGNAQTIAEAVLGLRAKLASFIDRDIWLKTRQARLVEATEKPLAESQLGKQAINSLRARIDTLAGAAGRLAGGIARVGSLGAYVTYVQTIERQLRDWHELLGARPWDSIAPPICEFTFENIPRMKASPEKDAMKSRIDSLKSRVKSLAENGLFCFTEAQLRDGLKQTLPAIVQVTSLVDDFERAYAQSKHEAGTLDFNDLEHLALQLLREPGSAELKPSKIAREYRRQFKHVIVDEYQDVNPVQDAILDLLSGPDNHFAVGDVKQSIYRFRQADPGRFISRYVNYKRKTSSTGNVIDLQKNFRSRAPLLETLNGVFEALMTRESAEVLYNASQRLVPGAAYPEGDGLMSGKPVELIVLEKAPPGATSDYDADEREAIVAAVRIRELLGLGGAPRANIVQRDGRVRPVESKDIVILLRAMRVKAEHFAGILRRAGIPVQTDNSDGFFSATEVIDMLGVLKLLTNRRDDLALAGFLRSPLSGWRDVEDHLATIRLAYPAHLAPCFHQAFLRYGAERDDAPAKLIRSAEQQLETWRALERANPVADVMQAILRDTSYLAYISGLPDGRQRVANVLHLHQRARQFEGFQNPTVARFLQFLTELRDESDLGLPSVAGAAQNAVRIMSIHKSKGQEFPVVILPDLGRAHNFRDATSKLLVDDCVGLAARVVDADKEVHYASLATALAADEIRRKAVAEELRVLYVAGTRAKEHLILIGTDKPECFQEWADDWSAHQGPIPPGDVRDARSMLDWIGPAASIVEARSPGSFSRAFHPAADVEKWGETIFQNRSRDPALLALAELKPLPAAPARSPAARQAIARLEQIYPFAPLSGIPAMTTVTALTKSGRAAPGGKGASFKPLVHFDPILPQPRCLSSSKLLSPADVGSMTHAVLQRLDFSRPCDRADLLLQIQELAERRFIRKSDAPQVNLDAILWLLSQPIAGLLRSASTQLLRELSITFTAPADSPVATSQDKVMVRGRLDAVIVEPDGLTIIDYKTDRVTEQTVDERATFYRGQIDAYRRELENLTRLPVKAAFLIFLTPRLIRAM